MNLIPEINITKLKELIQLEVDIRTLPSFNLLDCNDSYIATIIIPPKDSGYTILDEIKNHAEMLGVRGNSVLPQQGVLDFHDENQVPPPLYVPEQKPEKKKKKRKYTKKVKEVEDATV